MNEWWWILIPLLLYPFCVFACFRVCVFAVLRVCVDKIEFLRAEKFVFACCNLRVCVQLSTYKRILLYVLYFKHYELLNSSLYNHLRFCKIILSISFFFCRKRNTDYRLKPWIIDPVGKLFFVFGNGSVTAIYHQRLLAVQLTQITEIYNHPYLSIYGRSHNISFSTNLRAFSNIKKLFFSTIWEEGSREIFKI